MSTSASQEEKPILALKSCNLYPSDVCLFDCEGAWLNDACISFYFTVLQAEADLCFGHIVSVDSPPFTECFNAMICDRENEHRCPEHIKVLRNVLLKRTCTNSHSQNAKKNVTQSCKHVSYGPVSSSSSHDINIASASSPARTTILSQDDTHQFRVCEEKVSLVLFVDPCVAYWISMCEDEDDIEQVLKELKVDQRLVTFWPINDNQNPNTTGGTHWTLLVQVFQRKAQEQGRKKEQPRKHAFTKSSGSSSRKNAGGRQLEDFWFFHFDSLREGPSCNLNSLAAALRLQDRICNYLATKKGMSRRRHDLVELRCECPQTNLTDCGIYCLMYAEIIFTHLMQRWAYGEDRYTEGRRTSHKEDEWINMSTDLGVLTTPTGNQLYNLLEGHPMPPPAAAAKRKEIRSLIYALVRR